jgi:hypothetical protein
MIIYEASSALAITAFASLSIAFWCFFCEMTERSNVTFVLVISLCVGVLSLEPLQELIESDESFVILLRLV